MLQLQGDQRKNVSLRRRAREERGGRGTRAGLILLAQRHRWTARLSLLAQCAWQTLVQAPRPTSTSSLARLPPSHPQVSAFLLDNQLCKKDQVKVHGF